MEKRIRRNAKHVYQVDKFTIEGTAGELVGTFVVQQYRYDSIVEPKLGDIVFDIGAYVGDTALWFSKAVGPQGKVYAFEPEPSNFAKLKANLERNNVTNVIPLQLALSENEGEMRVSSGAGSSVITQAGTGKSVKVTTIDNFVEANKLPRVDFIKMDVEGHELKVLTGAKETIKTFKPSLALSAYHRGDDLIELPKSLLKLIQNTGFTYGTVAQICLKQCFTPLLLSAVVIWQKELSLEEVDFSLIWPTTMLICITIDVDFHKGHKPTHVG